jgi:hypothetical protein
VGKGPEDVVWRVCGKAAHAEKVSLAVVTSYEVLKCVASDDEGGWGWGGGGGLGYLDGWIGFVWDMEFEVVVGSVGEVEGKRNSVLGCVCVFFFFMHTSIFFMFVALFGLQQHLKQHLKQQQQQQKVRVYQRPFAPEEPSRPL